MLRFKRVEGIIKKDPKYLRAVGEDILKQGCIPDEVRYYYILSLNMVIDSVDNYQHICRPVFQYDIFMYASICSEVDNLGGSIFDDDIMWFRQYIKTARSIHCKEVLLELITKYNHIEMH